jgi:hypothetical protein
MYLMLSHLPELTSTSADVSWLVPEFPTSMRPADFMLSHLPELASTSADVS